MMRRYKSFILIFELLFSFTAISSSDPYGGSINAVSNSKTVIPPAPSDEQDDAQEKNDCDKNKSAMNTCLNLYNSTNSDDSSWQQCLSKRGYNSVLVAVCAAGTARAHSIADPAVKYQEIAIASDPGQNSKPDTPSARSGSADKPQAPSGAQPASVAKTTSSAVAKPAAANISSGTTPSDGTQDLASCQTASSSATSACDVNQAPPATPIPAQTSNGQDTTNQDQSMSALCGQMRSASTSNASAWSDLVQTCVTKKKLCTDTCGAALTKWQTQQNTCGDNCDSIPITISQLTVNNDTCIGLAQNAQTLADNMNNAVNNGGQSAACQQQASGGAPASATNQNQQDQQIQQNDNNTTQSASAEASINCNNPVNANSAKCKGDATTAASAQDLSNNLYKPEPSAPASAAGFNTADANSLRQNQGMLFPPLDGKMKAASADAPPGNSGGMTGGQSGGSGYPAASRAGAGGGQPTNSKLADILKSDPRGGNGYTQGNSKEARGLASDGNGNKRARTASDNLNGMRGLDLKDYLPGGAKDPTLRFVGMSLAHPDISPQRENIFERVSTRFMIHCKLKLLFDCH
jgi:hypothetical protein